jgi:Ala-tRNA(Pro) deacylase
MPAKKLMEFLAQKQARFERIQHAPSFTAPETAASAHVSGHDFAKTVMVLVGDELAMVVLPANRRLPLEDLRQMLGTDDVFLASEGDFRDVFPDCEVGAMPPFGNLYGIPVYIDQRLTEEQEIAFNACTHREVIKMQVDDYLDLARPRVIDLAAV